MANPNGNPQNFTLKGRLKNLSTTEKQDIARKGGKKSGELKKQQKTMKELAQLMARCKPTKKVQKQLKETFPDLDDDFLNNQVLLLSKMFEKAVKDKDTKAFELFRDTAGDKPIDKQEIDDKREQKDLSQDELISRINELENKTKKS